MKSLAFQASEKENYDPVLAVSLYEKAWQDGVPIAAAKLGHLYEYGLRGALQQDRPQAWSWYQKGADVGEPNALARFAERADHSAVSETDSSKKNKLLLQAFVGYAAAAERAHNDHLADYAWKNWRFRRATLARILAREGLMQQVADAYTAAHDKWTPPTHTVNAY